VMLSRNTIDDIQQDLPFVGHVEPPDIPVTGLHDERDSPSNFFSYSHLYGKEVKRSFLTGSDWDKPR
jgi:hypothetical protein